MKKRRKERTLRREVRREREREREREVTMKRTPEGDGRDKCMPLGEEQSFYPSVRTLMAPVTLIKCLQSIKEYAFVKSPYPVIVTLEDHLTADLQAQVAEMVIETFGELLYYLASRCLEEFPSPEALKHRIIVSTKPPKEYLESEGPTEKDSSTEVASGKESPDLAAKLDPDDRTTPIRMMKVVMVVSKNHSS